LFSNIPPHPEPGGQSRQEATVSKYLYINNTNQDIRAFHLVIVEAIKNCGVFREDYADIFNLRKTPEGSACEWALELAEKKAS
jgi:hypothetical protein